MIKSIFYHLQNEHGVLLSIHSKDIVHRDLKLENLMLASLDDITTIKIVDFGLANLNLIGQDMDTICGTPQYVAPEIIEV